MALVSRSRGHVPHSTPTLTPLLRCPSLRSPRLLTPPEQVVMALGSRSRGHVPHRSSRLTSVLRESLGGNCKTVRPRAKHVEQTRPSPTQTRHPCNNKPIFSLTQARYLFGNRRAWLISRPQQQYNVTDPNVALSNATTPSLYAPLKQPTNISNSDKPYFKLSCPGVQ